MLSLFLTRAHEGSFFTSAERFRRKLEPERREDFWRKRNRRSFASPFYFSARTDSTKPGGLVEIVYNIGPVIAGLMVEPFPQLAAHALSYFTGNDNIGYGDCQ